MKRLSRDGFHRARDYLKLHARPLDRALFEYRFEAAPAQTVTDELSRYLNPDGGFGHALEPDVRTPSSSALATGIALGILRELTRLASSPMVAGAVRFLLQTFDADSRLWRVVPPDANEHPHAPWWHEEDGSLARTFDDFAIIPRAQIVALFHHYAELVPAGWLDDLTEETVSTIERLDDDAFAGGGDGLRYCLDLAEADAVPSRFKDRLVPRLRDLSRRIVCLEPHEWTGYCATPLKVAPRPDSAMAGVLWEDLQRNLDLVIHRQVEQGTWEPTWTWGDFYPEIWLEAAQEWRGHLTLETLTTLRAFGRSDA